MRLTIIFLLGLCAWAQTNPVALTVNTASPSYTIPPDFLGLSFETGSLTSTPSTFPAENAQFRVMVSQLGLGWVRFGGNSVDKTNWIGGQRTSQTPAASLTASDFDRVAAFARATGWRVLWGMRLANGSPTIDASEADYVITSASDVLSGLEIGNEPDLFSSNGYTPATLPDYLTAWGQYAAAIQAVHPKAILTGPAAAGNISTWTTQFGVKYGTQISLLTQHYYPLGPVGVVQAGAPNEATISNMLNSTTHGNAQSQGLALSNIVTNIATRPKIPWRMAETNSCYNGGQTGVSDVFASTLWGLDYMLTLAGTSAAGVNFHGGGTGTYTPIAVNGSTITARPLYYSLLMFGAAAHGQVVPVTGNAGRINLTAFGVLDTDGTLRVTVINKDQALDAQALITPGAAYTTASRTAAHCAVAHREDGDHAGRQFRGGGRNLVADTDRVGVAAVRRLHRECSGQQRGSGGVRQRQDRHRQHRERRTHCSAHQHGVPLRPEPGLRHAQHADRESAHHARRRHGERHRCDRRHTSRAAHLRLALAGQPSGAGWNSAGRRDRDGGKCQRHGASGERCARPLHRRRHERCRCDSEQRTGFRLQQRNLRADYDRARWISAGVPDAVRNRHPQRQDRHLYGGRCKRAGGIRWSPRSIPGLRPGQHPTSREPAR